MKSEYRANIALTTQRSAHIGRTFHVPGKGYRINKWRRLARTIVRLFT